MDAAFSISREGLDEDSDTDSDIIPLSLWMKDTQNSIAFRDHVKAQAVQQLLNDQVPVPSQKTTYEGYESLIDKARDYQQELYDRAKEENIIAVLDTGSGKTLIAALLIKYFLEQ